VEFRLLGPVETWAGGRRLELGPRKQRFVLAVLALKVNQMVSVDRLVDLTWPHQPPQTARHAIHVRISRLRATLRQASGTGNGVEITTYGTTYVLRADPMCIDAHRFRARLTEALSQHDDLLRVDLLRNALALWRGPALADVATAAAPANDELCRRLDDAKLDALEELFDAELRVGRHSSILDELTESVALNPFRQRLVGQLMLGLYRAGRVSDALYAYRRARAQLVDEFGLDPAPGLQRLEAAMLCADPALDLPQQRPTEPQWRAPRRSAGRRRPLGRRVRGLTSRAS
jgi:DNA-binding SARP family transcriptional activator